MNRYAQIIDLINLVKPKRIVEVGTWNGDRAVQMILHAQAHCEKPDDVHYIGFDLFEDATEETDKRESNVKPHWNQDDVGQKISGTGAKVDLVKGDTNQTLPEVTSGNWETPDFVFIDGGHSVATIESDWKHLKDAKTIVFDDYYVEHDGKCMDTEKFGCNKLVDTLPAAILGVADPVIVDGKQCGLVKMAVTPPDVVPTQKLKIKTKNCVPDEEIQANITAALKIDAERFSPCRKHGGLAVFCSGGPSLKDHLEDIRRLQNSGAYIFCVKHAHDLLLKEGIVPWACILLDPRGHVSEFIENPHPKVRYFVASMCAPNVWEQIKDYTVFMYPARS
jgi:predicted O-methyltransferase YrrM